MKKCLILFLLILYPLMCFAPEIEDMPINTVEQTVDSDQNSVSVKDWFKNYVETQHQLPTPEYMIGEFYMPVEVKIADVAIDAFSYITAMLYPLFSHLITMILIFLLIFWLSGEGYNIISSGKAGIENGETIVKKLLLIIICIAVINANPAEVFMLIVGPIIQLGTAISDFILNALTGMPETHICEDIKEMVNAESSLSIPAFLSPESKASLLCLTGRISQLYAQFIGTGLRWMGAGLLFNPLAFISGAAMIILFVYVGFKFVFESLSIIFDLLIELILLPFCAVGMCFGGGIAYKGLEGIPAKVFSAIVEIFAKGNLKGLFTKVINSVMYFCILSIIIGICYAMMAETLRLNGDILDSIPQFFDHRFIEFIFVAILTGYLIKKAPGYAKELGGSIDTHFAGEWQKDVKDGYKTTKSAIKKIGTIKDAISN